MPQVSSNTRRFECLYKLTKNKYWQATIWVLWKVVLLKIIPNHFIPRNSLSPRDDECPRWNSTQQGKNRNVPTYCATNQVQFVPIDLFLTQINSRLVVVSTSTTVAFRIRSYRTPLNSGRRIDSRPSVSYPSSPLGFNWPTRINYTGGLMQVGDDYSTGLRSHNKIQLTNLLI